MKKILILFIFSTLFLFGCGEKEKLTVVEVKDLNESKCTFVLEDGREIKGSHSEIDLTKAMNNESFVIER